MSYKPKIKPGAVFGSWTVVSKAEKTNTHHLVWNCVCSCGKPRVVLAQHLKNGNSKSCGCQYRDVAIEGTKEKAGDLVGKIFGKWTVIELLPVRSKNGGVYLLCVCECKREREVSSGGLLSGRSKSCGNCGPRAKAICEAGHVVADWGGRTPTGACKACVKNKSLFRCYGITLKEYLVIGEYQEWKCAICGKELDRTARLPGFGRSGRAELDHEHGGKTVDKKYVRGILCGGRWSGCNRKIGRIDNIDWLESVLNYLKNPPAKAVLNRKKEKLVIHNSEVVNPQEAKTD